MEIVVNRDLCEANQVCMRAAPSVFYVDEQDRLHLLVEHATEELLVQVKRAVQACPKQALSLVEEHGETAPRSPQS